MSMQAWPLDSLLRENESCVRDLPHVKQNNLYIHFVYIRTMSLLPPKINVFQFLVSWLFVTVRLRLDIKLDIELDMKRATVEVALF